MAPLRLQSCRISIRYHIWPWPPKRANGERGNRESSAGAAPGPDNSAVFFGLFAVTAMLVCYALEKRSSWCILGFAFACVASSAWSRSFWRGCWAWPPLPSWCAGAGDGASFPLAALAAGALSPCKDGLVPSGTQSRGESGGAWIRRLRCRSRGHPQPVARTQRRRAFRRRATGSGRRGRAVPVGPSRALRRRAVRDDRSSSMQSSEDTCPFQGCGCDPRSGRGAE